ncbi:MAG: 2-C-methyl-D-erythritol 4-phosphate cytidylyltransferase, partial [Bacteroidales bacterium]|nr:2-C-methyl-D-erythritol 4-phosphate cytidylyltransferase [Bacteroidales bacterium]
MAKKRILILVAGGHGTRMGSQTPKQFLPLSGKAVLQWSMERFIAACPGIGVVTVLPEEHFATWNNYCSSRNFHYPQILVPGGFTRFHSVRAALERVPDGAIVAVHDGVRPLVSEDLLARMFERMETERALIPVLPSTDTLKLLDRERETGRLVQAPEALDRSRVYAAQTPQMFRSEDLKAAYRQPYDTLFTDDASVAQGIN